MENFNNHAPYSICILHAFKNITRGFVESVFRSLNVGRISDVEMIPKVNQKGSYWQIFVHFSFLHNHYEALEFRKRLNAGKEVRIVYNNPWFWRIVKAALPHRGPSGRIRMVPFIDFSFEPVSQDLEPGEVIARPERCNAISTPDSTCHMPISQEEVNKNT